MKNEQQQWSNVYGIAQAAAAAHRATGQQKGIARRSGALALPLPRWVDETTAHDGIANAYIRWNADNGAADPTNDTARWLAGCATQQQASAAASPALAVTGCWGGRKAQHVPLDDAPEPFEFDAALVERENAEAIDACILALKPALREVAVLLRAGETQQSIAKALELDGPTVRKRVERVRGKLAPLLRAAGFGGLE